MLQVITPLQSRWVMFRLPEGSTAVLQVLRGLQATEQQHGIVQPRGGTQAMGVEPGAVQLEVMHAQNRGGSGFGDLDALM